jgi:hypothetical protein
MQEVSGKRDLQDTRVGSIQVAPFTIDAALEAALAVVT